MSALSFDAVSQGALARMSAAFPSGSHVVLGTEPDGTAMLIELAAGVARPAAGRVTLDNQEPFAHAGVRRRIAALFADEQLPPARDVNGALRLALDARGDARSAASVLDAAGISHLSALRRADVSAREARAIALALALSHPQPALLALFEPLTLVGILQADFVLHAITRLAAAGSLVLATASRIEDATRLGGTLSALQRGTWVAPEALRVPTNAITLRVHTPEPRRLAARLSEAPDVSAVEWPGGRELLVRGADLESLAAHVLASARSEAIRIEALRYEPPSLAHAGALFTDPGAAR